MEFVEDQWTRWSLESDCSYKLLRRVALNSVVALNVTLQLEQVNKPLSLPQEVYGHWLDSYILSYST